MKIIHLVLGKANINRMNGVNRVVNQLATEQHNYGLDVEVWGITKVPVHDYESRVFKTELYKAFRNPFKVDPSLIQAISKSDSNTIFHFHGAWVPNFAPISKLLKKHNRKIVLTPHGGYNQVAMRRSATTKKIYFTMFEKPLLKRTSTVHCIGQSEVDGLRRIAPFVHYDLIPYGFETDTAQYDVAVKTDEFVIGFVGRIDIHTKGLDLMLNGLRQVKQNFKFWIIGDGDDMEALKNMISELKLSDRVICFGHQYGLDKDNLIKQMDLFVHASRNEGLPSAVLEAASLGIPCLVSPETNVASVVTKFDAGYALEANSVAEIYQNVTRAIDDKALIIKGQNAQTMVAEHFSWSSILPQFNDAYKNAITT